MSFSERGTKEKNKEVHIKNRFSHLRIPHSNILSCNEPKRLYGELERYKVLILLFCSPKSSAFDSRGIELDIFDT